MCELVARILAMVLVGHDLDRDLAVAVGDRVRLFGTAKARFAIGKVVSPWSRLERGAARAISRVAGVCNETGVCLTAQT